MAGAQARSIPPGTDLYTIPLQPPPLGVKSDFNKPAELAIVLIVVLSIILPLMTLFITIRIYIRLRQNEKWWIDDWTALITAIIVYATSGVSVFGTRLLGHKLWNISVGLYTAPLSHRIILAEYVLNGMALFLGKLCVLTMYLRIFGHIPRLRKEVWVTIILSTTYLVMPVIMIASCISEVFCTRPRPLNLATGILTIVIDVVIFYIPIPHINRLNISRGRKRGVMALFLVGIIAVIADIFGLFVRVQGARNIDPLRYGFASIISNIIDASISVIIGSLPSTAKFWRIHIVTLKSYQALVSRFSTDAKHDESTRRGLPSWFKKPATIKRKYDPYSIDLHTTNLSTPQVCYQERRLTPLHFHNITGHVSPIPPGGHIHNGENVL